MFCAARLCGDTLRRKAMLRHAARQGNVRAALHSKAALTCALRPGCADMGRKAELFRARFAQQNCPQQSFGQAGAPQSQPASGKLSTGPPDPKSKRGPACAQAGQIFARRDRASASTQKVVGQLYKLHGGAARALLRERTAAKIARRHGSGSTRTILQRVRWRTSQKPIMPQREREPRHAAWSYELSCAELSWAKAAELGCAKLGSAELGCAELSRAELGAQSRLRRARLRRARAGQC